MREREFILHIIAIVDLVWFVYLFCRYEARPLNKSTDHTRRRKKEQKKNGWYREGILSVAFFDGKEEEEKQNQENTESFSRRLVRYTLMKEREM